MLRVTDDGRPLNRATRWGLVAVLGLAAFGASAVRGPAQAPAVVSANDLPPFELNRVPARSNGLIAFRPAAVLSRPGMKPVADQFNALLASQFGDGGIPPVVAIPAQEIEQIVVASEYSKLPPPKGRDWKPEDPRHIEELLTVLVRMTHDFDWPALIRSEAAKFNAVVSEIRPGIYRIAGNLVIYVQVVDRRTVCLLFGRAFPRGHTDIDAVLADVKPAADPAAAWGPVWRKAQQAAAVVAFDNRSGYWTDLSQYSQSKSEPFLAALVGGPTHTIASLELADTVTAKLYMSSDPATAKQRSEKLDAFPAAALAGLKGAPNGTAAQRNANRIAGEMLNGRSTQRGDVTDVTEFRSSSKLADFFSALDPLLAAEKRSQ